MANVNKVFRDLIAKQISRESADRWAYLIMQKSEIGEIDYIPQNDKTKIWEVVMYLYGIDLQVSPGVYLHSFEEIEVKFHDIFK